MAGWSRTLRRLYGAFGILWIGTVGYFVLLSPRVPVAWKVTGVIWGGVGLVHMVAALLGREEEWGPRLDGLFRIGFWLVWLGFAIIVLQFLVLD